MRTVTLVDGLTPEKLEIIHDLLLRGTVFAAALCQDAAVLTVPEPALAEVVAALGSEGTVVGDGA